MADTLQRSSELEELVGVSSVLALQACLVLRAGCGANGVRVAERYDIEEAGVAAIGAVYGIYGLPRIHIDLSAIRANLDGGQNIKLIGQIPVRLPAFCA
ncbi:MAG TPA: hypothetical protein VF574_02905 [Allosphingosinicella sp.]